MVAMVSAYAAPTVIDGTVYSGSTTGSDPVPGVTVDVTCESNPMSDVTDSEGEYFVFYDEGQCDIGETATACVGDVCAEGVVSDGFENLNILGVDIFNVPEFSLFTAGAALTGSVLLFVALRKRN